MESATYVALSRQIVLARMVNVLANNIANGNTTGFKSEEPLFEKYLAKTSAGKSIAYVQSAGSHRDLQQGDLAQTDNSLDAAIQGDGYFTVGTTNGTRYTRNGKFQLNAQSQLVSSAGDNILDSSGSPVSIPTGAAKIAISSDGTVTADGSSVAKLGVVKFDNPQDLAAEGGGLLNTTDTPTPDATSQVLQGRLESSNVRPIIAMTQLMDMQRSFTAAQDVLDNEDSRMKSAIDKLSKVA